MRPTITQQIALHKFFDDCSWFYPVLALLLAKNGYSPIAVVTVFAALTAASLVASLAYPALLNRRLLLLVIKTLALIKLILLSTWLWRPESILLLLTLFLWCAQSALSGLALKDHCDLSKLGIYAAIGPLASLTGGLLATIFFDQGIRFLMMGTWLMWLISLGLLLPIVGTEFKHIKVVTLPKCHPNLYSLFVSITALACISAGLVELAPILLPSLGLEPALLGVMVSVFAVSEVVGYTLLSRIADLERVGLMIAALCLILAGSTKTWASILFLVQAVALLQSALIQLDQRVLTNLEPKDRSQWLSLRESGTEVSLCLSVFVMGVFLQITGPKILLSGLGMTLVFLGIALLILVQSRRDWWRIDSLRDTIFPRTSKELTCGFLPWLRPMTPD